MKKLTLFMIALTFLLTPSCTSVEQARLKQSQVEHTQDFRLQAGITPRSYDLTLWANTAQDHFSGLVKIDLAVEMPTNSIAIHSVGLDVSSVLLRQKTKTLSGSFRNIGDKGIAKIIFDRTINQGLYELEINYRGKYQEDLSGLYRVQDGQEKYLYTQFEALSARKMMPCFDEPRFKTPFSLKVISEKENKVIANAPLLKSFAQGDKQVHLFKKTKPISTYLVALAVGPFDVVSGPTLKKNQYRNQEVSLRGIATKGKGKDLEYALRETPKILDRLEEYFNFAYPFQKLDILAVPDFRAGAMENVGAVTFREWYLLLNEKTASVKQKRGFHLVMAHELAHMWFGNLVTMPWWDDLWLNEAFATWLSYKITTELKPEYKTSELLLGRSHRAMTQDSIGSARRIREPIVSNHDIHNAFDGITYAKGGAVLSMLENYLGPNKFRQAVNYHINRFAYRSATSQDFLKSLAKFSDRSLARSTETFLNQTGVPNINLSYTCNNNGFRVNIAQDRYAPLGAKLEMDRSWEIPMCLGIESQGKTRKNCFTLNKPSISMDFKNQQCPAFINPNLMGQGYYRYSLNQSEWQALLNAPAHLVSEADRLAAADSLMASLHSGRLEFAFVAEQLKGLVDENSSLTSKYFINLIKEANHYWIDKQNLKPMNNYAKSIYSRIHRDLSKKQYLTADQKLLKEDITKFFARVIDDKQTQLDLTIMGGRYLQTILDSQKQIQDVDENIIDDAVAITLMHQNDKYLDQVFDALKHSNDTLVRGHLLYGLSQSRTGKNAAKIRSLIFEDGLRRNEQLRLFYRHLSNPKNQPDTWDFVKNNFAMINGVLADSQKGNLPYLAEGLCTAKDATHVKEFFQPMIHQYQGGPRNLAEVVEQIEICAARKSHTSVFANRFFDGLHQEAVANTK